MDKTQYSSMIRVNREFTLAVLLTKNTPAFLAGCAAPVGGRKELYETFLECCIREFGEEAGRKTAAEEWHKYAICEGPGWEMHCYFSVADSLDDCVTCTDEPVHILSIRDVLYAAATPAGQGGIRAFPRDSSEVAPDLAALLGLVLQAQRRRSLARIQYA